MTIGPTTLADLSVDQFGQLIDVDIYPHARCSRCGRAQAVVVWGAEGYRWAASCGECNTTVPAEYVTFITSSQFHDLVEHGIPLELQVPSPKPS